MARYLADLHLHSHFSRATSRDLTPPELARWGRKKGLTLLGTGDCTHPGWLDELETCLLPDGRGLLRLAPGWDPSVRDLPPILAERELRFLPTAEVSTIYRQDGTVHKVHHLCLLPDLTSARRFSLALEAYGNLRSDGRPIVSLSSRDLLDLLLTVEPRAMLIPAPLWTPWFSALGSKSGFDRLEDCYGELVGEVTAVETGLSSDPPMNRRCSFLDRYLLVSNSDAHSPSKLGREATLFDTELSFDALRLALRTGLGLLETLEFFPEEGKYHHDGHRSCGIRLSPEETTAANGLCPICGRCVTLGVASRVETLADRRAEHLPPTARPHRSLCALPELLAEMLGKGSSSLTVHTEYHRLLALFGSELQLLLEVSPEELGRHGGTLLAEGIARLRRGQVSLKAGYDGVFGTVRVFDPAELPRKHRI